MDILKWKFQNNNNADYDDKIDDEKRMLMTVQSMNKMNYNTFKSFIIKFLFFYKRFNITIKSEQCVEG